MSSLVKTVAIVGRSLRATPASQRIRLFDVSARRNMGSQAQLPWNYLWQPGPYPRTKEECDAAAKKYVSTTYPLCASCQSSNYVENTYFSGHQNCPQHSVTLN